MDDLPVEAPEDHTRPIWSTDESCRPSCSRRARRRCRSTRGATAPGLRRPSCSATCEHHRRGDRSARQVALDVLRRIEDDGAYANLALGPALQHSGLGELDRKFVTELVYGTTRMRRACDALVDRFLTSPPDAVTRTVLRLGTYQLAYAGVPPHAAVGETVGLLAEADARARERSAAQGVPPVTRRGDVAVGRGEAQLSGLDRRHVPRRTRRRGRRRTANDEHRAVRDAPRRRIRAGRVVPMGRRGHGGGAGGADLRHVRRTRRQVDGDGLGGRRRHRRRPAPEPGATRPRERARPRSGAARAGRRRRRTAVRIGVRSTRCCSTRRVPASARCAAEPMPVGASNRTTCAELALLQGRLLASAAELVRPWRSPDVQRVHDHFRRVDRPSDARRVRGRRARAGGRRMAALRAGVARASPGCRHRRHGR